MDQAGQTAEAIVSGYAKTQLRMVKEQDRLRQAIAATARRAEAAERAGAREEAAYYRVNSRMFELFLKQMESFGLSSEVLSDPDAAALATVEYYGLMRQAYGVQAAELSLARLAAAIGPDLAPALAGEPATPGLPKAWLAIRAQLSSHPEWADGVRRFLSDRTELVARIEATMPLIEAIDARPAGPGRLAALREANVPALRGELYRVEAHLRRFAWGVELIEAMQFPKLEAAPEAAPAAPARRKGLTDRFKGLFGTP